MLFTADEKPNYDTSPGNDTTDKVFLLSITEVKQYFASDDDRKCAPTDYEIAQGTYANSSYTAGGHSNLIDEKLAAGKKFLPAALS